MEVCTEATRVSQPQKAATKQHAHHFIKLEASQGLPFSALKTTLETPIRTRVQRDRLKSKVTLPIRLMFAKPQEAQRKGPTATSKIVQDENQFKTASNPSSVCSLLTHPPPHGQSRGVCLAPACTFAERWVCS